MKLLLRVSFTISLFLLLAFSSELKAQACACGAVTTFTVDLSSKPDTTWTTASTRSGLCCGAAAPDRCIKFIVTVHPQSSQVGFSVVNPSPPGGAFYQVDCGIPTSLGTPLCLSGITTFCLTYCKAGGDSPDYIISASRGFAAGDDITIRENCTGELTVGGLIESSIAWTSVFPPPDGTYNGYLSCLSSCDTSYITPPVGAPAILDYEVCGIRTGCISGTYCDTQRVFVVPTLSVNVTPSAPIICTPGPNVTLSANASGGNPPYTYSWSTGETTSSIVVGVGTYTAYVDDDTQTGCGPVTQTVTVTSAPTPASPTLSSNTPICEGEDLSLTSNTYAGGTYNWSGPNSFTSSLEDPVISGATTAAAGTYSMSVTVAGCTSGVSTTAVTVNPNPASPVAGSNSTVCSGQVLSLTASTIAGASYSWSGPNSFTSTDQNPTIPAVTTDAAGTYSVNAIVSGCSSPIATTVVAVNQTPTAPGTASNTPICSGQTLTLAASTIPGASYFWSGPNSFTSASQTPSIPGATTAASGNYSVTATVGGCTSPAGIESVTVNLTPSAPVAGSNSPVCTGQTLSLTASTIPGATYFWSGPNSFTSASQNPSIAGVTTAYGGTYSVSATASGCTGPVGTTVVTVNSTPAAPTPGSNSPICAGQTLSLTSNTIAGATYNWSGPNSFTSAAEDPTIPAATTAAGGTYSVSVTVTGCTGPVATTAVTVNPTPAAPVPGSNSPICEGQTLSLTSNTIAGATYSWSGPNSFTSASEDPTIPAATTAASGTYSVFVTVGGCQGPTATTAVTVSSIPAAPTAGSNSTICAGQTLSLTANTIAGATYNWSGPNSFTSAAEDPTIPAATTAATGTYSVYVTVAGCDGPVGTTVGTVSPIPAAPTPGSNSPLCTGYTLSLTSNTIAGATYNWSGPNSFTSSLEDPTIPAVTTAATGNYSVSVSVAGCQGPAAVTTVTVEVAPASPTPGSNTPVCAGATLNLTATATGISYNWTGPNSFTSTLQNPSIVAVTTAATGNYSVTATSANGCVSTPPNVTTVSITPTPTAPVVGSNSPACLGGDISLTATTFAGASYSWSGPNSFTSTDQNPVISGITSAAAGTYSVFATVAGCTGPVGTGSVAVNAASATPTITSNGPVCVGQTLSLATDNVPSGSYNWSGPNSFTSSLEDPTIAGVTLAAGGTYSLFITVPGCASSGTGTLVVTVNPTPAPPVLGSNSPVCAGYDLSLTATGAGPDYNWTGPNSFTSTTEDPVIVSISTAGAGTYSATQTSAAGCTSSAATTSVTVNTSPAAPVAGNNSPLCTGSTLSLTASSVGTSYNWAGPNSFTSTVQNPTIAGVTTAEGGTYSVTATAGGCTGPTGVTTVTITVPETATPGSNTPICEGEDISLTATTVAGATYNWTGPNSFTSSLEDPTISSAPVAADGTYSVTVTVSGCTGPATTTSVTVNALPAAPTAGSNSAVCLGSNLSLTASTIAGATYNWTGPNSFTSTDQNPVIAAVTSAEAGTYSVVATITATGCVGPAGTEVVVINPPPAAPTLGSNAPICSGTTLSLTATALAGASYSWTGPNSFTSSLQNPTIGSVTTLASGNYSMTATVPGCPPLATETISVTINQTPAKPTAGNNTPVCVGESISLTATGTGVSYDWTGPNSFTSTDQNPVIAGATTAMSGTYSVTTTSAAGCTSLDGNTTVTVSPVPAAPTPSSNSPLCSGQTLNLTANTIAGATYNWSGPNSFTSSLEDPTVVGITTADAGTYTVNVTVAGCQGPDATTVVAINETPAVLTPGSNSPVCVGLDLSLTANTVVGASYSWTGPNSFTSTDEDPVISSATPAAAGVYSVTASVGGCTNAAATTVVVVNPTPTVSASSNTPVCIGNTISLTATTVAGGTYNWSGPNSFTSTDQNPTIAGAATVNTGTYTVNVTSVDGCVSPDAVHTVTVTPLPVVSAGIDQTVCGNNANITLTGTVSGGTSTGVWSSSGTGIYLPGATSLTTLYITSDADTGVGLVTFTLTSTNNGGCVAQTSTLSVTITDAPAAYAGSDVTVCANNATVTLSGAVNSIATGGIWSTSGTGSFSPDNVTLGASYIPSDADTAAGSVVLTLTTTGVGDCSPTADNITVTITDAPLVNAGSTISVCSNNANAVLSGYSSTGSGAWTTAATGTFVPSAAVLTATFVPSAADIASGSIDLILTSTSNGNCNPEDDTVTVVFTDPPTVMAGADQTVCANNNATLLSGSSTTGAGIWTTSGTGTFVIPGALTTTYVTSAADNTAGTVTLTLTSTSNGGCVPVVDDLIVTITPAPTADAGADQTVCANNAVTTLSGSFTISSGAGWVTTGSGTFSPDTFTMGATYTPSAADTAAGLVGIVLVTTGNGDCNPVTDTMYLTITDAPLVDAGANTFACKNNPNVSLSGYSSTGTAIWTTTGTGTFTPTATTLGATYNSSPADTTAGSVILVLTSTGNGNCLAEDDSITVTYIDKPIVNAGADLTVCSNNPLVSLSGSCNTGSGVWSTLGTGTFTPTATALTTTYVPSTADTTTGFVQLVLTSTNNGTCLAVTDTLDITLTPAPTANAGADQTVCANNAVVTLSGSHTVSSGAGWITLGSGTFAPDTFSMGATYTPSAADTAAGLVGIVLVTTGNGICLAVTDTMYITITDAPLVEAGANQLVCLSNPVASISGTSSTGSGVWTTMGTGTFTSTTSLATTYTASPADTTAGSVQLVLTSTANGNCNPVTDTVLLTFVTAPVVSAGSNQTVCANADTLALSGTSSTGSGIWSSNGSGFFDPDSSLLVTTYVPGASDVTNGTVTITFTSTGGCIAVSDSFVATITPAPIVNAGINQLVCAGTQTVSLSGSVTAGASTGAWTTSGSGVFIPDNLNLNATYSISPADSAAGSITITLTSTANGNCYPESDAMVINIMQPPVALAGPDTSMCGIQMTLNGVINGGSGTGMWTTVPSGDGFFFPDSTNLNAVFAPLPGDTFAVLVLTSTNNGPCPVDTDTMEITVQPGPAADAGPDLFVCKNNLIVTLSGTVIYTTQGQWSTAGTGTFVPSVDSLNAVYIPSSADTAAGSVELYLITKGDTQCVQDQDTLEVFFTAPPDVDAGANVLVCYGDTVAPLNGAVTQGASTGQWSSLGSGYFIPNDSALNATYVLSSADTSAGGTTLVLTSTNFGNCVAVTDTVDIIITPVPVVAAGSNATVCANNAAITLSGSVTVGATTGIWSTSGTGTFTPTDTSLNATYNPSAADTAAGLITITLTSTQGCRNVQDSIQVTITDAPTVNAGANLTICGGGSVNLNGLINSAATGGLWSTSGNGTFVPTDSTLNATYVTGSNDTGVVIITLTSTGNGQCLAVQDSFSLSIGSDPVAGFSVPPVCIGSSTLFTDTSSISGSNDSIVSWNWTINNGTDSVQNPSYSYSSAGFDTITLIITSALGCTDTVSQIVSINVSPAASYSFNTTCSLDSVYFTDLSTITSGNIVSWNWNLDTVTSTAQNPVHYYDSTGQYVVSLTVTSDSGCVSTFMDTVVPAKGVQAGFLDSANCALTVQFNDTSIAGPGDSILTWSWDFGDGSAFDSTSNPVHTYPDTGSYIVTLNLTTLGGCNTSLIDTIQLAPLPTADFIPNSGSYNSGDAIAFTDLSSNAVSWWWSFGDGLTDTIQNPTHNFNLAGVINVTLAITNSQGCTDTVFYPLTFNSSIVVVPSAFTPNNDGVNDILSVLGGPLETMDWRIYNEWGNEIFRSTNQSDGWDGTYKGKLQPASRFVWILTGSTYAGAQIELQGDVTIIR